MGGEFGFYCVHHVPALSEPSLREPVELVVSFFYSVISAGGNLIV